MYSVSRVNAMMWNITTMNLPSTETAPSPAASSIEKKGPTRSDTFRQRAPHRRSLALVTLHVSLLLLQNCSLSEAKSRIVKRQVAPLHNFYRLIILARISQQCL